MEGTVYVTGADRGLGFALTEVFLETGYKVYAGSYLNDWPELSRLQEEYPDLLRRVPLDVTSEDSVEKAAQVIQAESDELDILINNAGTAEDRSGTIFDKQYFDDIRRLYEINALGPLRVTQSVLPLLLAGRTKRLVNISSLAGSVGTITRVTQYGYTMSKAALNMQTKLLHNHLRDKGVRVLAIHPGGMRTHIFGDAAQAESHPLAPEESARAIIQLILSPPQNDHLFIDYLGNPVPW